MRPWLCCIVVGGACACGGSETTLRPAPVPVDASTSVDGATADGMTDASLPTDASPDADRPRRTVSFRNPWGRQKSTNLLFDGDFELSGLNAAQYPWIGMSQEQVRIGAVCRSGLRCLGLAPRQVLGGMFTWPSTRYVSVSFFARVTGPDCDREVAATIQPLWENSNPMAWITAETKTPREGWCQFASTIEVPKNPGYHFWGLLLAARESATGNVVIDDAVIEATSTPPLQEQTKTTSTRDASMFRAASRRMWKRLQEPVEPPPRDVENPTGARLSSSIRVR